VINVLNALKRDAKRINKTMKKTTKTTKKTDAAAPAKKDGRAGNTAKRATKVKAAKKAAAAAAAPAEKATKKAKAAKPAANGVPKEFSKSAIINDLISRKDGATLAEIMKATGWQAHSVRGFLSTLGKKGTSIVSTKTDAGERNYAKA